MSVIGVPLIAYQPPGETTRTITFPYELTEYEHRRVADQRKTRTVGGVEVTHRGHAYDTVNIGINQMPVDDTFYEAMVAFWAWAGTGGRFGFAMDNFTAAFSGLELGEAKGSTSIDLTSPVSDPPGFSSFNASRWYRLHRRDGTAEEFILVDSLGISPIELVLLTGIVNSYSVDDFCSDPDTYWNCVASQDMPLVKIGNKMRFKMTFRSNQNVGSVIGGVS